MRYDNILMIPGAIIVLTLAWFWMGIVSVHPNWIVRIIIFGFGFAFSSYVATYPLVYWAREKERQRSTEEAT